MTHPSNRQNSILANIITVQVSIRDGLRAYSTPRGGKSCLIAVPYPVTVIIKLKWSAILTQATASIQTIVFGKRNTEDYEGVLRDVKKAGYPAFETGNMHLSIGKDRTNAILAETGLRVSGMHLGFDDFADAEKLGQHMAFAKAVDTHHLMCSAKFSTKEEYANACKVFDQAGERLSDAGLSLNYHNHAWEFDDIGGLTGIDYLLNETKAAYLKFNIDIFWCFYGSVDPAAFIRANGHRADYLHFKDGEKRHKEDGTPYPHFLELGRGDVDVLGAMQAAREIDALWIVSEQDSTEIDPSESAAISRNYMLEQLGV